MTVDDATQITSALFRMYPSASATADTFKGYVEFFARLHDPLLAVGAVNDAVLAEKRLPSVASINESYKARVHLARGETSALESGEVDDDGYPLPKTAEEWGRLGQVHRKLRTEHFGEEATEAPLPHNRSEFNGEWAEFLVVRYAGKSMAKGMP